MPAFFQAVGGVCLVFAVTAFARPRIRPSPSAYRFAITVDALCILFVLALLASWPHWWMLVPLALWGVILTLHLARLRDARIMVAVLRANHPPSWGDPRRTMRGSPYAEDDWDQQPPGRSY